MRETGWQLLDAGGDPRGAVASVFSWSYNHLPADAAQMFRLLGMHPGPDLDWYAAAALTGTSLTEAGRTAGRAGPGAPDPAAAPGRYSMHDLLRDYAATLAGPTTLIKPGGRR